MLYLGTSIEEAQNAIGDFSKYEQEEKDFPKKFLDIYSALPRKIEREIVQYFSADGWWYSIVAFNLEE
jgi:hypothetical protein